MLVQLFNIVILLKLVLNLSFSCSPRKVVANISFSEDPISQCGCDCNISRTGWLGGWGLYQTCLEISGGLQGVEKGLIVMS